MMDTGEDGVGIVTRGRRVVDVNLGRLGGGGSPELIKEKTGRGWCKGRGPVPEVGIAT
jgi:hypothetical protein